MQVRLAGWITKYREALGVLWENTISIILMSKLYSGKINNVEWFNDGSW